MNTLPPSANGAPQANGISQSSGIGPLKRRAFDTLPAATDDGARVKLALFGRPIPELLGYASNVYSAMEDNEFFPDPQPPQDELAVAIADAEASTMRVLNLKTMLAAEVALRDQFIDKLLLKLDQRGSYVQMASGGNARRIVSTGIDVRRQRRPVPELDVPSGLYVELNGTAGVVIITWNKVKHAKMYMIEYGPVDGPKIQRPMNGLRKLILHELPLGETYQFRIAAMGGATGQSYWGPWVTRGIA